MKRGYYVYPDDEFWGVGVVANTAKEAKKLAFASGELIDVDWIDIRVRWERSAEVEGLPIGVVRDMRKGLLCGLYGFIEGFCDNCGTESTLELCSGRALCYDCREKEYEKDAKNEQGRRENK